MHILLVNAGNSTEVRIPQGLLYLASAIKASGYSVSIHDETLESDLDQSLEKILAYDADIIGLSVYSTPLQLKRVEYVSKAIKANSKSTLVIWGGWHATLYPKHSISNKNVDIVVHGPSEKTVPEILNALDKGLSLNNISNLVIKENEKIIETATEIPAAEFLYPELDFQLIDLNAYLERNDLGGGVLQYLTSRGCYGRCQFCLMSQPFIKGRLVHKPKNQVVGELQYLLQNSKVRSIHFSNDHAFRNNAEALELCNILKLVTNTRNVPWRCAARIDVLSRLSDKTYEELTTTGCKGFVVGIESGVDKVLQLMKKDITETQIYKALKSMSKHNLSKNLFFFLFNFPGETEKEALKSLKLARKIRLSFPKADIALSVYFPGYVYTNWLPKNILTIIDSNFSKFFDHYYDKHIRNFQLAGVHLKILRYYFNVCKIKETTDFVRRMYRKWILLRIKTGIFIFPFEYYLSNIVIKKIRKILGRK
ncbi:MAG: B12-binding domain-containing radical SAM protein [Planctomycetota bacterium]|jgi:anaerobic magnesium-protoporphyrin IX monomethyl ester cyclase